MRTRLECPLCEEAEVEARHFLTTARGYELGECPTCGLIYGKEILDAAAMFDIYDEAYARRYEERPLVQQNRRYAERFFGGKPRGRLLEIGCGTGHFLRRLAELGYAAFGVEASSACASFAADLRVTVIAFEDMPPVGPAARFDYVVSFHVLEHVAEPLAFARKVASFLKPEGIWFNYMPDVRARGRRVQRPSWIHFDPSHPAEHVNFFDENTLRALAERARLRVYDIGKGGDDFWCEMRPVS